MTARDGSFLVGLIGSGIDTSLSPSLHEREADEQGLRYLYRLLDLDELRLPVGDVLAAARRAGFDGLNITHPAKQLVLPHLDAIAPDAAAVGAVNTVVFTADGTVGHNTDLPGFARSVRTGLPGAALDRVVVLGAGGAGAAVVHGLISLGAKEISVLDVDHERAVTLAARVPGGRATARPLAALVDALRDADGLVHATPTGMAGHPGLPLPTDLLHQRLWVADVVYRPLDTELLLVAAARGCRVLDGGRMAVFQAADAFRLFTGVEPDADRMLRHFDSLTRPRRADAHAHR